MRCPTEHDPGHPNPLTISSAYRGVVAGCSRRVRPSAVGPVRLGAKARCSACRLLRTPAVDASAHRRTGGVRGRGRARRAPPRSSPRARKARVSVEHAVSEPRSSCRRCRDDAANGWRRRPTRARWPPRTGYGERRPEHGFDRRKRGTAAKVCECPEAPLVVREQQLVRSSGWSEAGARGRRAERLAGRVASAPVKRSSSRPG
jgi:hypothetical protein